MQPGFHSERIAGYIEVMSERSTARAASWSPGVPFDLVGEINKLTLDILLRTLFAGDPGPRLRAAVKDWLSVKYHSARIAFSPTEAWAHRIPVLPRWQPPDPGPLDRLRAVQQEFIDEYRAAGADRGDLLSMLIRAEGPEGSMSDREVGDELITLFLAGTGTVSAALAWTVYEVARHTEVQHLVRQEVDAVLGGRAPTLADIPALSYCRRVVTEALRLHPVVWLDMRRTTAPQRLGPYELPEQAELFVSPYGLQLDPRHYPNPYGFRPDRWPADKPVRGPREAYLPFGAGNRMCLGEDYAWSLLVVALAAFATRWRFELVRDEPVRALAGTVLRPDRLPVTLTSRSTESHQEREDEHAVNS
jgi:cytochrome P450